MQRNTNLEMHGKRFKTLIYWQYLYLISIKIGIFEQVNDGWEEFRLINMWVVWKRLGRSPVKIEEWIWLSHTGLKFVKYITG